jgi:hypothetical protein
LRQLTAIVGVQSRQIKAFVVDDVVNGSIDAMCRRRARFEFSRYFDDV